MTASERAPVLAGQERGLSLSFLDLLYAVVIGEVATRVSDGSPAKVPVAGWGAVGVGVMVIVLSWYGYHRDRTKAARSGAAAGQEIGNFGFWEIRFAQFVVEVLILGVYFALVMQLRLGLVEDPKPHVPVPSAVWQAACLLVAYGLYLFWDYLDVHLSSGLTQWNDQARRYRRVTGCFLVLFGLMTLGVALSEPDTSVAVTVCEVFMMALLYLYRVAQDPK